MTDREREILDLVSCGLSNAEIGDRLAIAEKTVKHYMTSVLAKLGARSRVEAALVGYKAGLGREDVVSDPSWGHLAIPRLDVCAPGDDEGRWPNMDTAVVCRCACPERVSGPLTRAPHERRGVLTA